MGALLNHGLTTNWISDEAPASNIYTNVLIHFKVMLISAWKNRLFQKHVPGGPNKPSLRAVAQI